MIQPCIELYLVFSFGCFYFNTSQILLPDLMGLFFGILKGFALCFSLQIDSGIFYRSIRKADFGRHCLLLFIGKRKVHTRSGPLAFLCICQLSIAMETAVTFRFPVKNCREIKRDSSSRLIFFYIFRHGNSPTLRYVRQLYKLHMHLLRLHSLPDGFRY